jgi:XTP/dITP diphosphohydrolase
MIATRNAHKTREIQNLLGDLFAVHDLSGRQNVPEVVESGRTFAENAIIKARTISRMSNDLILADDSGLEVDLLDGAPGVLSARYAGDHATDLQNIEKLLGELHARTAKEGKGWSARFRCVMALARGDRIVATADGVIEGVIVEPPRGHGGFGFDPIFQPIGYDKTFAELGSAIKNQISHRARAIAALRPHLPA